MVVRLNRSIAESSCVSSCSLLARLGCTERSARLARMTFTSTTPRSVNDVEVHSISNLLVDQGAGGTTASEGWSVSCSCDLLLWL